MVFSGYSGFFHHTRPQNTNIRAFKNTFINSVSFQCNQSKIKQCLMHQSFEILTFLNAKLGYMLGTLGHFYSQGPSQILEGKCEIMTAGLGVESKALQCHGTAGMMLRSVHGI